MNVLMLSTDQNIFKDGSASQERMKDYGDLVEELHIVVFARRNFQFPISNFQINSKFQISKNVWIYPTNTSLKPLYFFNAYKIAKKILVASGQWLVTTQDPFETGLVGYLLKKKFKLPLQIQAHTDFLSPYFWKESLKNKIRVILGKWLVKKADGIRVVSERIKNSLCSRLQVSSSKIIVLPIFVDIQKIKNNPIKTDLRKRYPNHDFIILMASRLTKEKNIGLAIGTMKEIVNRYPKTLLLIVGDGPELEGLKLQVTSYKLQDSLVFEPWTDDIISYYKTADLFLLISNYEGYGRTAIEAAAANLPVLMTDVGVAIGSVVRVGDHKDLTQKLESIINGELAQETILESQKKVLSFYLSKHDFLDRTKSSWQNCFS